MTVTTPPARPTRRSLSRRVAAVTLATVLLSSVPVGAFASTDDDPNLDQNISEGQPIVHGERTLEAGHVDMGPRFDNGTWAFLIHDDVAKADANATSVWRYPDETVFHIVDEGELTAPDDAAYSFLGAEPGSTVWVSPQTQNPDVVWIGWNTQDPDVMAQIDRGVTLTLHRVQGPGTMTVFLQSGSFGEPQQLWDSRVTDPQPLWVDVNTHTHANWAFTQPGVYLIEMEASADLIDGSTVTDTQTLRVAVGSATAPADALTATWTDGSSTSTDDAATDDSADTDDAAVTTMPEDQPADPLVPILVGAIVLVAAGLIVGVIVVVIRGGRSRRQALAARDGSTAQIDEDAR